MSWLCTRPTASPPINARVRDELLNLEEFSCPAEARVLIEDWRLDYNAHHPHSALGM